MAKIYTAFTWVDEILGGAERFDILEDGGGAFKADMQINLSTTVTTPGSTFTAARLQNIENGIDALDDRLNQDGDIGVAWTIDLNSAAALVVEQNGVNNNVLLVNTATPLVTITADAYITGGIQLGHATDTSIVRVSAGLVSIGGSNILMASDIGSSVQAYDADLDTYAGITPSANIQSLLGAADYGAMRTQLGLVISTNVQAYDADLDTYAGITPSANVQSLLGAANYAAMRVLLDLETGSDLQAWDADLDIYAGITPSANIQTFLGAADYGAMRTQLGLVISTNVQAWDADLDTYAGITPSANIQTFLGAATYAAMVTQLSLTIGSDTQAFHAYLADIAAITGAQGDIIYFNGTDWVNLGPGTSGQFLKTLGAAANPAWDTIAGGGDLLAANNLSDLVNAVTATQNLSVELGVDAQAYDANLTTWAAKTAPSGTVLGTTDSQTLTNKTLIATSNITTEKTTVASDTTPNPTGGSNRNQYDLTALAAGATFAAPSGTPVNGNILIIRIIDDGTTRTLAYDAIYRAVGQTLPTDTTASKTIYIGCVYNSADSKWDVIAVVEEV